LALITTSNLTIPLKPAFFLLLHNNPESAAELAGVLASKEFPVLIHLDKSIQGKEREEYLSRLQFVCPDAHYIEPIECKWGEWSLVQAVLNGMRYALKHELKITRFHLLSGADLPIRSLANYELFLQTNHSKDFIECHDFQRWGSWIKGGFDQERFDYTFPYNFQNERAKFDEHLEQQRQSGQKRALPANLHPHMGSQWFNLRWSTCKKILTLLDEKPEIEKYFEDTWIPDESFFQTLVAHLIPWEQISGIPLLLHCLTPNGRPFVFRDGNEDLLKKPAHFFTRKVSPRAQQFRNHFLTIARGKTNQPLPNLLALRRQQDQLNEKITGSYELSKPVPGHVHDDHKERFFAQKQPIIIFYVQNHKSAGALINKQLSAGSSADFSTYRHLNSPFRLDGVDMPKDILEICGMTERSLEIRDRYTPQIISQILEHLKTPISLCVCLDEDFQSHLALHHLPYQPIIISDPHATFAEQLAYRTKMEKWIMQSNRLPIHLKITEIGSWMKKSLETNNSIAASKSKLSHKKLSTTES